MTKVVQYIPCDRPQEFFETPFGKLLTELNVPYTVDVHDLVHIEYKGKIISVEPYMYVYLTREGTLYTDWSRWS